MIMGKLSLVERIMDKLSKKAREKVKLENRKLEIEKLATQDELLAEYIAITSQLNNVDKELFNKDKLEELRLAVKESDTVPVLENKWIKISIKNDYTKTVFNTQLFYDTYNPKSKMYQKFIKEQPVKGSIKLEIKE